MTTKPVRKSQKQLIEKFEKDAVFAESKAREYSARAASLREKIARMKRDAEEVVNG